jgi:glycosyltransferase involved in cell wall biosynthesis
VILLTTSDYYPKLGGLSTFTSNIETVLQNLGKEYEVFHWKNRLDIKNISTEKMQSYSHIINIHPRFCWEHPFSHLKTINFIHGSEILMTSPNIFKKFVKIIRRKKSFSKLEESFFNIFISEITFKKSISIGLSANYGRDIVLHNCIDIKEAEKIEKNISSDWVMSCIVRNAQHKNLPGTIKFCEVLKKLTNKNIELIVPRGTKLTSNIIKITQLESDTIQCRNEAYKRSHFNLLLTLDNSKDGFYEGFGLTVLEAAIYGTPSLVLDSGGLPEAVHHKKTGWVLKNLDLESINDLILNMTNSNYKEMADNCYKHTISSHSLNEYTRFFKNCVFETGAA